MSEFGEWKVNKHYGCIHNGETLIARVANFSENASTPDAEANARLIAAAPEMYELLKVWTQTQVEPTLMNARKKAKELLARIEEDKI